MTPPPSALRTVSPAAAAGARSLPLVNAAVFRQALSRHPAGVAIVTLPARPASP